MYAVDSFRLTLGVLGIQGIQGPVGVALAALHCDRCACCCRLTWRNVNGASKAAERPAVLIM